MNPPPSTVTTPRDAGFRMPAEWAPHAATWLAWPSHEDLWGPHLAGAREAFCRLVSALATGETAEVLVPDAACESLARAALPPRGVRFHRVRFGDIWLRDTAPIFLVGGTGDVASVRFAFNGWGGKYVLPHDEAVAQRIAHVVELPAFDRPFVLEGGAIDVDGEGTALTTRQCLLNANRNGALTEGDVAAEVHQSLGVDQVLWFDQGLVNDHTDGHVDTLVRFVRPGVVVAMEPRSADDPNRGTLEEILRAAATFRDAHGRRLEVVRIPSPGRVVDEEGRVMPASYANFYIGNAAVVVPTYGAAWDAEAVEGVAALFPGRQAVGVDARDVLSGGGAFHCITQQQPSGQTPSRATDEGVTS